MFFMSLFFKYFFFSLWLGLFTNTLYTEAKAKVVSLFETVVGVFCLCLGGDQGVLRIKF